MVDEAMGVAQSHGGINGQGGRDAAQVLVTQGERLRLSTFGARAVEEQGPILRILLPDSRVLEPSDDGLLALDAGVRDHTDLVAVEVLEVLPAQPVEITEERHDGAVVNEIDEAVPVMGSNMDHYEY